MCGIAGLVDAALVRSEVDNVLRDMTGAIVHRGPDDDGYFVRDGLGLGMRRLSIIDVEGGNQPAASEDGAVQVVFNGEIYNFRELRQDLEARGHRFRSDADTEVIAHLFEDEGEQGLVRLRGMFTLAVWDERTRRLVLARDRLGKKPLYYAETPRGLIFGSEIKSLLAARPELGEPDPEAIVPYLRYGFVPEPGTWYRCIRTVPPGHWLAYSDGNLRCEQYWALRMAGSDAAPRDLTTVREELDALLEESVRLRLVSDVPLGVFLSGGLDSSTIVAYASRAGLKPLRTFTVGFDRHDWDESEDAQLVADHFGTEHHVLTLRERDLASELPGTIESLVRHYDQPFGDSSALPTFHVSRLAREHVTVILGGDGGDELFAGYSSYRGARFAELYRQLPSSLGRTLPRVAAAAGRYGPRPARYGAQRVAKVLRDSSLPFEQMYLSKNAIATEQRLHQLMPDAPSGWLDDVDAWARQGDIALALRSTLPDVAKASYADLRLGLLNDILVKVDRMSMAHSLEVRSPLLDHRLVEYVAALPPELKLRGWETKAVLRDVVNDMLPPRAVRKPKQGFVAPLREWLRTGLSEMVGDYLDGPAPRLPDAVDRRAVQTVLAEHRRGTLDHSRLIWLLLTHAAWQELYAPTPRRAQADRASRSG